jgi:hypothetical protein
VKFRKSKFPIGEFVFLKRSSRSSLWRLGIAGEEKTAGDGETVGTGLGSGALTGLALQLANSHRSEKTQIDKRKPRGVEITSLLARLAAGSVPVLSEMGRHQQPAALSDALPGTGTGVIFKGRYLYEKEDLIGGAR